MVSLVINTACSKLWRTNYIVESGVCLQREESAILPGPTWTSRMHAGLRLSHRKDALDVGRITWLEKVQTKGQNLQLVGGGVSMGAETLHATAQDDWGIEDSDTSAG